MSMTHPDHACALIVIDLPKALIALPPLRTLPEVLARGVEVVEAFGATSHPAVMLVGRGDTRIFGRADRIGSSHDLLVQEFGRSHLAAFWGRTWQRRTGTSGRWP